MTENVFERLPGDLSAIGRLDAQFPRLKKSSDNAFECARRLLIAGRSGALIFAHLARAGFVAVAMVRSAVGVGILSPERAQDLMRSVHTVSTELDEMLWKVKIGESPFSILIEKFGHLRAGTYDINSPSYRRAPDQFLRSNIESARKPQPHSFFWSEEERVRLIKELSGVGFSTNADDMLKWIKAAISAREYGKFVFTRYLSEALDLYVHALNSVGVGVSEARHLPLEKLLSLSLESESPKALRRQLKDLASFEEEHFISLSKISLPSCIREASDLFEFEQFAVEANYITMQKCEGRVVVLNSLPVDEDLTGCIVAIANADPGFDFLFGMGIGGLITAFGGPNSHMAIRASERQMPAVIGVGEAVFSKFRTGQFVYLDCAAQSFRIAGEERIQ
jgi:phosphohistidine swiveling domain-containing protein